MEPMSSLNLLIVFSVFTSLVKAKDPLPTGSEIVACGNFTNKKPRKAYEMYLATRTFVSFQLHPKVNFTAEENTQFKIVTNELNNGEVGSR
jgi:hypothetical protein